MSVPNQALQGELRSTKRTNWDKVQTLAEKHGPPIVTLVVLLVLWEVLLRWAEVPVYVLPKPTEIARGLVIDAEIFWAQGRWTIYEAFFGAVIGSALGIGLGMLFALVTPLERGIVPLIVAATSVPIVAIAPVVNIWLGAGVLSKIILAAFLCFFPCCINTIKGMHSTEPIKRDLFRCLAASRFQVFTKLQVPSSLPFVFTGLKISATTAVIATIVAEFVGAHRGIGYLIISAAYEMRMPRLWGSVVISMALGITFFTLVGALERAAVPWREAIEEIT
jgi:NitT/TauT family transport system permease protein